MVSPPGLAVCALAVSSAILREVEPGVEQNINENLNQEQDQQTKNNTRRMDVR